MMAEFFSPIPPTPFPVGRGSFRWLCQGASPPGNPRLSARPRPPAVELWHGGGCLMSAIFPDGMKAEFFAPSPRRPGSPLIGHKKRYAEQIFAQHTVFVLFLSPVTSHSLFLKVLERGSGGKLLSRSFPPAYLRTSVLPYPRTPVLLTPPSSKARWGLWPRRPWIG